MNIQVKSRNVTKVPGRSGKGYTSELLVLPLTVWQFPSGNCQTVDVTCCYSDSGHVVPAPQSPEGRRPVCIQSLFILWTRRRAVMETSWVFNPNSNMWANRGMYRQGSEEEKEGRGEMTRIDRLVLLIAVGKLVYHQVKSYSQQTTQTNYLLYTANK